MDCPTTAVASMCIESLEAVAEPPLQIQDYDIDFDNRHFCNRTFRFDKAIGMDCHMDFADMDSGTGCDTHCFVTHESIHCMSYSCSPVLPARVRLVAMIAAGDSAVAVGNKVVVVLALN